MEIGSKARAAELLDRLNSRGLVFNSKLDRFVRAPAPKGFSFLADGADRDVYLDRGAGLVYKYGSHGNWVEYEFYLELSKMLLPDNVRLPRTALFSIDGEHIIVQEHVKGRRTLCDRDMSPDWKCTCRRRECFHDVREQLSAELDMCDLHGGNVLLGRDGNYWVVDMGE